MIVKKIQMPAFIHQWGCFFELTRFVSFSVMRTTAHHTLTGIFCFAKNCFTSPPLGQADFETRPNVMKTFEQVSSTIGSQRDSVSKFINSQCVGPNSNEPSVL